MDKLRMYARLFLSALFAFGADSLFSGHLLRGFIAIVLCVVIREAHDWFFGAKKGKQEEQKKREKGD